MPTRPIDLTALLGSRLCHDLISPIGAIGNGVELMQLSGVDSPEMALISEAVNHANQRIRYFRIAFGTASHGQMIGAAEITRILTDDAFGPKLALHWQPGGDLPRDEVKLVFLALLCLETAMPFGGEMQISHLNESWQIAGRGTRLKPIPELWAMANNQAPDALPAPAHLQFALLRPEAENIGRSLEIELAETEILIRF